MHRFVIDLMNGVHHSQIELVGVSFDHAIGLLFEEPEGGGGQDDSPGRSDGLWEERLPSLASPLHRRFASICASSHRAG
jgi:hypothetical protein